MEDVHARPALALQNSQDIGITRIVAPHASSTDFFFSNASQFRCVRNRMHSEWAKMSTGNIEQEQTINLVEIAENIFDPNMRQQCLDGNPVNSIGELYEAAKLALPIFEKEMQKVVASTGLSPHYLHFAPLKDPKRATEKAKDDYDEREPGHGYRWLFDIARASLICETEDELITTVRYLKACCIDATDGSGLLVARLKNRFKEPTPSGFRDLNANIRICINNAAGDPGQPAVYHMVELQIHCRSIKDLAKDLNSHKVYEYFRTYFRGNVATVQNRLEMLDSIFDSIYDKSQQQSGTGSANVPVGEDSEDNLKLRLGAVVASASTIVDRGRIASVCRLLFFMCEHDYLITLQVSKWTIAT